MMGTTGSFILFVGLSAWRVSPPIFWGWGGWGVLLFIQGQTHNFSFAMSMVVVQQCNNAMVLARPRDLGELRHVLLHICLICFAMFCNVLQCFEMFCNVLTLLCANVSRPELSSTGLTPDTTAAEKK